MSTISTLILDEHKEWLNIRCNNLTVDGDVLHTLVSNKGAGAITLLTADGITLQGGITITANTSRVLYFRITNIGTPAVSVY